MTASANHKATEKKSLQPGQILVLGFLILILVGGFLLTLPISSSDGRSLGLHNGMFTATSAVCVTGLSIIDAGLDLSFFGQLVLLLLIQMGGLGFMVFATLAMVLLGRRISLRNRMVISESMNQNGLTGMVRLTMWFSAMAVVIELIGAAILSTSFVPIYGWGKGIWFGIFHAVSAFCNAGFDLLGNNQSLLGFQQDGVLLLTLSCLIILGGMGFAVLLEFLQYRKSMHRLSLHTKLVLSITGILLLFGTVSVLLLEWGNPGTLGAGHLSFWQKLCNSFFQSVTSRTAGFASLDQAQLNDTTKLITCLLMFVGASSASTGGGVKTTTFAILILLVITVIKGRERITVFGKEISQETARRAVAIVTIAVAFLMLVTCVVSILERHSGFEIMDLTFETTSAITTTGLSSIGTSNLRIGSQILLMPLMYLGRVGPLTLAVALAHRMKSNVANRVHHPEEKIMIG
ncbi:MAG: potassium transporter TrkG [Eubacteriales bacterium]|nr:potassium transporter TrkG [Eubacteriales bacterium]